MTVELTGYIERITFSNPENSFTVAKMKVRKRADLVCLVGHMPPLQPGETVRCVGNWHLHPTHGQQFLVERITVDAPASVVGIHKYLGSGLIKGIGPVYAGRIVDHFGEKTLEVIDQTPQRLSEIPGLGRKRIARITRCWEEQKVIREVMIFLQSYGVSPAFAQRIFKTYGQRSIELVRDNPYRLARDVFGIGFKTADAIAQKMGIASDAPRRIEAGIEFVLSSLSDEGHVCFPQEDLIGRAATTLEVSESLITPSLATLAQEGRIVVEPPMVWKKPLFLAEQGIAEEIRRLRSSSSRLRQIDSDKALVWVEEKLRIRLAKLQKRAVAQAVSEKVQIITGGPGTGKSTITKAILGITSYLTRGILLAAPTGRAAKRMTEVTYRPAQTIHSLLEWDFKAGCFKRNHDSPLTCDLLIVDEASMIDTMLMNSLLKAIPDHARVILIGDIDQLPSVGPGNVLRDMINAKTVPVTRLTEIFRQAAGSHIVTNAHRINRGEFPYLGNDPKSDFFFVEVEEPEEIQQKIRELVTYRLPKHYGFDPFSSIQVLAPMKRGMIGTFELNRLLQEALNPSDDPVTRSGYSFHVGDKVMQLRNNYDKKVFNGDVGRIVAIDREEQEIVVEIDGNQISYDFYDLDELTLAYAVSVHKYQGSECPCIVIPIHTSHFKLLHRNLLYTAVTRGKKLVILVGTKKAIAIAIRNNEVLKRHTGLQEALKTQCPSTAVPRATVSH